MASGFIIGVSTYWGHCLKNET
ncbi:hypothetical protein NC651_022231 [Populus alba x Populus x berolinensis]|nr:hypothetical protein NC651_022231 [Populus alba x Populus x berolinensis]